MVTDKTVRQPNATPVGVPKPRASLFQTTQATPATPKIRPSHWRAWYPLAQERQRHAGGQHRLQRIDQRHGAGTDAAGRTPGRRTRNRGLD